LVSSIQGTHITRFSTHTPSLIHRDKGDGAFVTWGRGVCHALCDKRPVGLFCPAWVPRMIEGL
jgi:hypothetical protein